MANTVYTVGHSTHPIRYFLELLSAHSITALVDVRSSPYSRFNPQFNREDLKKRTRENRMKYVFLGEELGARSDDPDCYVDGRVDYHRLAATEVFKSGIARVAKGSEDFTIAIMCAEKEPLECHRTILVARHLIEQGMSVMHILADGSLEPHELCVRRLLSMHRLGASDFFRSEEDAVAEAYDKQGKIIAYEQSDTGSPNRQRRQSVAGDAS
ncbi:MAG: DUF488 domain-containing protein [Boseongicola sp. SB0677_bin_26]|nr:DUF488 domain-containing protein [Boseongicola sp. SB0677_bin_26]